MHPNLKESRLGHNEKLRHLTDDYGLASGPANNIVAPMERAKDEAPGDGVVGFGSDSMNPKGRGDRPARRPNNISNPIPTYAKGGAVRGRKGKGNTHVNVIVAPQSGPPAGPPMPPVIPPALARPPMPPPGGGDGPPPGPMGKPPMGGAMPPGGLPMAPGAPGGIAPGLIPPRAKGGRVHADEAQDKALIERTLKNEGLVRSDKAEKMGLRGRANGGRLPNQKHHMTAGAASGDGRLEKIGKTPHNAGRPQAV